MKTEEKPSPSVFYSHAHPGSLSWGTTFARSLAKPLATCMLPVMIITLICVLQGLSITLLLIWFFPAAVVIAFWWTMFRLKKTPAEIYVYQNDAAVRTVWEYSFHQPIIWDRILDVRDYGHWTFVAIGLHSYEINQSEWPRYQQLNQTLKAARYER